MGPICLPFRYPKGKWVSTGNRERVFCLPMDVPEFLGFERHGRPGPPLRTGSFRLREHTSSRLAAQKYSCLIPAPSVLCPAGPCFSLLMMAWGRSNSGWISHRLGWGCVHLIQLFLRQISRNRWCLLILRTKSSCFTYFRFPEFFPFHS